MALLNLGGPGWFNDVFEVELDLDSTSRTKCRSLLLQEDCPVYTSTDSIIGKVKLVSPPKCSVWHYGVELKLEKTISYYDSMRSVDQEVQVITLNEGEYVTGSQDYSFSIDLKNFPGLDDSYDGEAFSVRYGLSAIVKRPWYTFDVVAHVPLAINLVSPKPENDIPESTHPENTSQDLVVSKEPLIQVGDCGGDIRFAYGKCCYNIGDTLTGTVTISQVPRDVVGVKLLFYKIESADDDEHEHRIREVELVVPDKAPKPSTEGEGVPPPPPLPKPDELQQPDSQEPPAAPTKPSEMTPQPDREFTASLVLDDTPDVSVGPTYVEVGPEEDCYSVHYYIRLELVDSSDNHFWNTHELVMYRGSLTNMTAVDV